MALVRLAATFVVLVGTSITSSASAHESVDSGVRFATEARFEEALASFERAWLADDLERDDVVTLLSHRALVHFAMRDAAALERDLTYLVVLAPEYDLPANVPPPVRARFHQLREQLAEPPSLSVSARFGDGMASLALRVRGLPPALVREVRFAARVAGDTWITGTGPTLAVPSRGDAPIEWFVEVIGPGGAVIVHEGRASAPRRLLPPTVFVASAPAPRASEGPASDAPSTAPNRARRGWAIGASSAAVVLLTSIVIGVVRDPTPVTHVSGPVLR